MIESYASRAGKKAGKSDTRAVAEDLIPFMVDQLDDKISKETKTADRMREYLMQARDPQAVSDPKFASEVVSALLGTRKQEIIMTHADSLLVHPFVIEYMINAMAPAVLAAYADEYERMYGGRRRPAGPAGYAPAGPSPAVQPPVRHYSMEQPPAGPSPAGRPGHTKLSGLPHDQSGLRDHLDIKHHRVSLFYFPYGLGTCL